MTSVGPQYAGGGSNVTGLGTIAWVNSGNIISDNNSYATCPFGSGSGASSNWLVSNSHDFSTIGASDTIDGIVVEIGILATTSNRCSDTDVFLTKDGTNTVGTDKATGTNVTNTEVIRTYGSSTDLWGTTWTASEIKASTFGCMFRLLQGLGATTAEVDYIRITVYYTAGATNWALSGSISSASAVSGTLNTNYGLTGTVTNASAVAGTLTRTYSISATITSASALTAALGVNFSAAASILAASSIDGNLDKFLLLAASITAASAIAGGLALSMPLVGSLSAGSSIAGTLTREQPISSTITGLSDISGSLGNNQAVSATIIALSDIIATLLRTFNLSSTISAVAALAASLILDNAGVASVSNASSITADMGVNRGLTGDISNSVNISGTLSVLKASGTLAPGMLGDNNTCDLPP